MPFNDAAPYDPKQGAPVIKMRVRKYKHGGNVVIFTLSKTFIQTYMPGLKKEDRLKVQYGTGDNNGQVIITKSPNGDISPNMNHKGSATLTVMAWRGHTTAVREQSECIIITQKDGGVVVKDPFK